MYLLMYANQPVVRFDYHDYVEILDEKHLPESVTHQSLNMFLYDRATKFRARETYQALLVTLGTADYHQTKEVFDRTYGLSLNDLYWIKSEDDPVKFADINFYEHPLDHDVAMAGYLGKADHVGGLSPEYTTDGQLPKCLIKKDGQVYMVKRGSTWGETPGREAYDEYYASELLDALKIRHVSYDLTDYAGHMASICPYMTDLHQSYVPISCFDYKNEKEIFADFVQRGFALELRQMLLFDSLVYNYDRHIGNFGYLKNNETGEYAFAPLFDHGNAFFPLATQEERSNLTEYCHQVDICALGVAFDDLVRDYLTDDDIDRLDLLDDFSFQPHPRFKEDVSCYNSFLKKRILEMKKIRAHSR